MQAREIYLAFAVMSVGWATMSGAAINIIVAPWFDRRRGLAISWALNGGSAGGVLFAPLLTFLIARSGFAAELQMLPPSHPSPAADDVENGFELAVMVRSGLCIRLDDDCAGL